MGDMKISAGQMISASPESREATPKSAKDTVSKHVKSVKDISGGDLAKAAVVGAVGAVTALPVIAGAAAQAGAKAVDKASEHIKNASNKEKTAVKSGVAVGLLAGPAVGLGTYLFVSGKAKEGCEKMLDFIKKHPEALLATPNQKILK